jgi:hypothetical protein
MSHFHRSPAVFLLMALFVWPVTASAAPESLGKFNNWEAFSNTEDGQTICYMSQTVKVTAPAAPAPAKGKPAAKPASRGPAMLMITHRPTENSLDVVSYSSGIKLRPASDAKIEIDGKQSFNLFTQNDTAWSRDAATDKALATAIRGGTTLTFTGTTARSGRVTDSVNLKGSAAAYRAISKACGLSVAEPPVKSRAKP